MKGGWAELTAEAGPNAEQEEIKHLSLFAQSFSIRERRESTGCIRADSQLVKNVALLVHVPKEKRIVLVS